MTKHGLAALVIAGMKVALVSTTNQQVIISSPSSALMLSSYQSLKSELLDGGWRWFEYSHGIKICSDDVVQTANLVPRILQVGCRSCTPNQSRRARGTVVQLGV